MKTAKIFGRIDVPEVNPDWLGGVEWLEEVAEPITLRPEVHQLLEDLWPNTISRGLFATKWIGPHKEEGVVGDVTLGVVLAGDHYLITGNRRRVGDLVPGAVFALCNKELHGYLSRDKKNPTPLVLALSEPDVAAEEFDDFCSALEKRLADKENRQ